MERTVTVDDIIKRIGKKIKPQWWAAFFGCVICGLIAYMYIMTNNFLTYDTTWNIYSDQDMISSGRQFLTYACGIGSFYNLPWVNGVLAIFYLALTSIVVVEGLGIESKICAALTGGLLVTFPAVASTFCYIFTVDGYMLAVLLSALAFLIADRKKLGFLGGYPYPMYYFPSDITKEDLMGFFGADGSVFVSSSTGYATIFKHYLNFTVNVIPQEDEINLTMTEEYASMPKFPLEGSVAFIGDVLVVKLDG